MELLFVAEAIVLPHGSTVGGADMLKGLVLRDVDLVDNDGVSKLRIVWSLLLVAQE
uniref:Uncharacterized protein n=1 Tax=Physcomitrium patens TaxID=3218 RepID=A0A2K1IJT2_PHYPA|nr:hypothetical protein PHYPA_028230 [Physcomitrium patens]